MSKSVHQKVFNRSVSKCIFVFQVTTPVQKSLITLFKLLIKLLWRPDTIGVVLILGLVVLVNDFGRGPINRIIYDMFDACVFFLGPAFFHNYKLVLLYDKKLYVKYFSYTLVFFVALGISTHYANLYFSSLGLETKYTLSNIIVDMAFTYFTTIGALGAYRVWRQSHEATKATLLLREMEVKMLSSQINPHFLFNTLNALYNMSLKNDPKLPESLLKISELMRYLLSVGKNSRIPLWQEVAYLENYVAMEQLRLGDHAVIHFKSEGYLANHNIAPILLLPFIENAFKHGVELNSNAAIVEINLAVQHNQLFLQVYNSRPNSLAYTIKSGTGLRNVQRRLDLLYPNNYDLQIDEKPDSFEIILELNL